MTTVTAFHGPRRIASGPVAEVAAVLRVQGADGVLVFEDATGKQIDLDLRDDPPPARGRPKLGVTAREVTLLPRQWEWLAGQPGGASATLRRLIEAARQVPPSPQEVQKAARTAAYHFLHAISGDFAGYEAALRALFAGDAAGFGAQITDWPADIRAYAMQLAGPGLA
jgi:uncharacterized protein